MLPDTTTETSPILELKVAEESDISLNTTPEIVDQQLFETVLKNVDQNIALAEELLLTNDQQISNIKSLLEETERYKAEILGYKQPKQ